jgi:2-iminobutanoate/2-iminopropanoate deaminase
MAKKVGVQNEKGADFSSVLSWGLKLTDFSELYILTGQGAVGADFRVAHPGDPVGQVRSVLQQLDSLLVDQGYSRDDIIKIEFTATKEVRGDQLAPMMDVFGEYLAEVDVKPAWGTYRVVEALAIPGMLVEVEFLAGK